MFPRNTGSPEISFSEAGAYHSASHIKGIYYMKMYLFTERFKLTRHKEIVLKRTCRYIGKYFTKAWILATNEVENPI